MFQIDSLIQKNAKANRSFCIYTLHASIEYYKEYKQKPEEIKRRKEYMKEYMQTPEYKAKKKEYDRVYNQQPEVKERRKEYYGRKRTNT